MRGNPALRKKRAKSAFIKTESAQTVGLILLHSTAVIRVIRQSCKSLRSYYILNKNVCQEVFKINVYLFCEHSDRLANAVYESHKCRSSVGGAFIYACILKHLYEGLSYLAFQNAVDIFLGEGVA